MPRYQANEHAPYFCTITILDWVPIFIDSKYIEPIMESLAFCRANKGLSLFAYVIMPHHAHFIAAAEDLHAVVRDLKRFTSRVIHERLLADGRRSVLDWLRASTQNARQFRGEFSLWQDGFHPKQIDSQVVFDQKTRYIHENPVRKGLVTRPEQWWYSSASWYLGEKVHAMAMDEYGR